MKSALRSLRQQQRGQTMAEYAVVVGMITIGIVVAFAALNGSVRSALQAVVNPI